MCLIIQILFHIFGLGSIYYVEYYSVVLAERVFRLVISG